MNRLRPGAEVAGHGNSTATFPYWIVRLRGGSHRAFLISGAEGSDNHRAQWKEPL